MPTNEQQGLVFASALFCHPHRAYEQRTLVDLSVVVFSRVCEVFEL
jgi:hypothetical protein